MKIYFTFRYNLITKYFFLLQERFTSKKTEMFCVRNLRFQTSMPQIMETLKYVQQGVVLHLGGWVRTNSSSPACYEMLHRASELAGSF